jgi:hypothetical protein
MLFTLDSCMVSNHTSSVVRVGNNFASLHKDETEPYTRNKS